MKFTDIKNNIINVLNIVGSYEKEMDKNGSRFNIFSILNLTSNEVRLHSNFIAELLNKNGTHSFGNQFCKLFILELLNEKINIEFNIDDYHVELEKTVGLINKNITQGGRIDIILTDNLKNRITIENKIYASDQKNQLLRYYNYDKNATLLYLTLYGNLPSHLSTNSEIVHNKDFYCISYEKFIVKWLKKCINISKDIPKVKETIFQYLHIIKNFTEQNERNKMTNELVKLIEDNKDFYNSIEDINQAYHLFRQRVNDKFWIRLKMKSPSKIICQTKDGIEVNYIIDEDNEGFYFGFYLEKNGKSISGIDERVKHLALKFNNFKSLYNSNKFITNERFIGWIFSDTLRKFWHLDNRKIFDLNNDKIMDEFVNKIINELNYLINQIKEQIK